MEPVTMELVCHAPHPDPRKAGEPCRAPLGRLALPVVFVTTAERAPVVPDGTVWARCGRRGCRAWNRFRTVPQPVAPVGDADA